MTKLALVFPFLILSSLAYGQSNYYTNDRDEKHLCGPVLIDQLTSDSLYAKWFESSYRDFAMTEAQPKWTKGLEDLTVDIYFGSWCGDSKNYVPKFIHLWDSLGLDRDQLNLIGLYDGKENYKQGPKGEEKGLKIHRVPTFIFRESDNEIARIVETPRTSLERDVAQIALGYPSAPSYQAATYLQDLLIEKTTKEIYEDVNHYWREAYEVLGRSSELNTLGYVYLRSDRIDEAVLCFHFNTYYFPYEPRVHSSYAEGLLMQGDTTNAIANYKKVLDIDPEYKKAIEQLALLEGDSEGDE